MRVTGGKVKGVQLKATHSRLARPTTNLVKQAVFSMLENSANSWHQVLDLYAGSGALGIEALSRGAEWVDFVDQSKECCDIIKYNLSKVGLLDKAHVYCCRVSKAIAFLEGKYDIVFMDPPYSDPSINGVLMNLSSSNLIGEGSIIVVCHSSRIPLDVSSDGLYLVEHRYYGDTSISIYRGEV
jgi:16S rRNA (guanine(966)-N(2))-methyltransferase RsmD